MIIARMMMSNHNHSQCLVSESGHIQCDGPAIQKRDEEASLQTQGTIKLISQSQAKVQVSKMLASLHDQSFAAFLRELIFDHAVIDWNAARFMLVHYCPDLRAETNNA